VGEPERELGQPLVAAAGEFVERAVEESMSQSSHSAWGAAANVARHLLDEPD
jgi:hypothetical protein